MQQRRFRPGDVLDDYCPRERRITDHAVVAMIDDRIKQTRCVVCDAEHEYKEGKVPPQRRKRPATALFTQVLDGLQGQQPAARLNHPDAEPDPELVADGVVEPLAPDTEAPSAFDETKVNRPVAATSPANTMPVTSPQDAAAPVTLAASPPTPPASVDGPEMRDEGPVRRPLIRASLPRPEGQAPIVTRAMPEFTIRQPSNGRGGHRPAGAGRRRGGGQFHGQGQGGHGGPPRFGRGGQGQSSGQGQRSQGGRNHGPGGGRSRRGGKKH